MELQLSKADFFFFENCNHFKVSFIAFEDNTFSVFVFRVFPSTNDMKCIATFDAEHEQPTIIEALHFLRKSQISNLTTK